MFNKIAIFFQGKSKVIKERAAGRFVIASPGSLTFVASNDCFTAPLTALNISQRGIALEYNGEFPKSININSVIQGTIKYPSLDLITPCSMRVRFMVPSVGVGAMGLEFVQINKRHISDIISNLAKD